MSFFFVSSLILHEAKRGKSIPQAAPLLKQQISFLPPGICDAIIFSGGSPGHIPLILYGETCLAQPAKQSVNGAFLSAGKTLMNSVEDLISIQIFRCQQLEQAQLDQIFFQHRDTPVPTRPTAPSTPHLTT